MDRKKTAVERVVCDLCGGSECVPYLKPVSIITPLYDECRIVMCSGCGLLYTNPRPTREGIAQCYDGYYSARVPVVAAHAVARKVKANRPLRTLWHLFCGQYLSEVLAKTHGNVLDVGCGTGELLEELRQKGCETHGVEFNPASVHVCIKKGLDVRCGNFTDTDFQNDFFDTVIFWHVLEHLPSPRKALKKALHILKPGGTLFIYSPNAKSYLARVFGIHWYAWQLPFHFFHFDVRSIQRVAGECGFDFIKIRAISPEYFVAHSLRMALSGTKSALRRFFYRPKLYHSLPFRLTIAFILRLADTCFPLRGECLRVELRKPKDRF
ncbi:MAG: class I SAM-dependent methyltransferase [Chitinispirillaceae bacterium]|nr:class I SAM-dependent methyltransferase [Chitinispirillaceae bacterium]